MTVYEQQYLYYQTRDVWNTQFVTRSGNDVVHADPGFQFLPIQTSGQGFSSESAANAASFDEYGIKPGHSNRVPPKVRSELMAGGNRLPVRRRLNDTLEAAAGNDYLVGNLGNDNLFGGGGADQIFGHSRLWHRLNGYPVARKPLPQGFPAAREERMSMIWRLRSSIFLRPLAGRYADQRHDFKL